MTRNAIYVIPELTAIYEDTDTLNVFLLHMRYIFYKYEYYDSHITNGMWTWNYHD